MKTFAIIQARMGSKRLPHKVLADIYGKPMLQRVVERVSLADLDGLVVATSYAEENVPLIWWCQGQGINARQGGLTDNDVLGRYRDVATLVGADVIVRITADCPLVDPGLIQDVLASLKGDVQYASNVQPRTFPDGLDVEAFTFEALRQAHENATDSEDREHVTPWMRRNLRCNGVVNDADLSSLKWSVDTQEDLEFMRSVYANLEEGFRWRNVLEWLSI